MFYERFYLSSRGKTKNKIKQNTEKEVNNQMEAMDKHGFGAGGESSFGQYSNFYPTGMHRNAAQKIRCTISRLKSHLGNSTVYNLKRGRVNMRAAMMQPVTKSKKIFKKFIPSKLNKTKLGVVFYLDASGSMSSTEFSIAVGATWTLSKALEDTGSMVKVYEYSDGFNVMKSLEKSTESTVWKRNYSGDTHPEDAMEASIADFKQLELKHGIKNKIAFIVTDGNFSDDKQVIQLVEKLKRLDVYVVIINIKSERIHEKEKYNKAICINSVEGLHDKIRDMVVEMQKRAIRGIA